MSKLKSNFIFNAAYQILILIIPFITTPYIARVIGVDGVGIHSYTYSIVNYFMMFALLGMNSYGNREVSKVKDEKEKLNYTFSSIYYLQLMITIFTSIIYIVYVYSFDNKYLNLQLIQVIYMISVVFDINWLFCGLQQFKITITRSAFIKISTLVLIFIFVKGPNDLWKYIFILAITTLINQMILWPFLKKEAKFVKVSFKDIKKHLKPTLVLFIPIIATSIYRVMDKIMIGKMSDITEVGYYENSEKMLNIIISIVSALGTVTLPQMTYLYNNGEYEQYYKILKKSIVFVLFLVFPVIFGFLATADQLVLLYLGNGFAKSSMILKILSISLVFSQIANIIRMQMLIPRNKDREYTISVVLGAIINFAVNVILIKKYGAVGAAISTVLAESVVAILQYYFVRKELIVKEYISYTIKFAVSSIIMFLIVLIVGKNIENNVLKLIVQVIIGVTIYCIFSFKYIMSQINLKIVLMKLKSKRNNNN